MKRIGTFVLMFLLPSVFLLAQSGADCTNAIPLTLDGVCRTFATSSTTGNPVLCTSYANNTQLTYFKFTTNSLPDKVLLHITAPTAEPCEILMYSSSSCTPSISSCGMCFDDGEGLWAPAHNYSYLANWTYYIRVKTTTAGNITICGQNYTPPNKNCSGAMRIDPTPRTDNNACHAPGTGVNPADLCAGSLENTAFYYYIVDLTGVSFININNIACDNQASNNSNGFQIGFFTGSCASLTPISCFSGSGSFVSASTVSLPAGTNVYVAIDGVAGSNCRYDISAINAYVLSTTIKNFSGWKTSSSNILRWATVTEVNNSYFEIQRSTDGNLFTSIGRVPGELNSFSEKYYSFEEINPNEHSFYRLKQVQLSGNTSMSTIVEVKRQDIPYLEIKINNPVTSLIKMQVHSNIKANLAITILNSMGQTVFHDRITSNKGITTYNQTLSFLPAGKYFIVADNNERKAVESFVKL